MGQSSLLSFFKPQVPKEQVTASYQDVNSSLPTQQGLPSQVAGSWSGVLPGKAIEEDLPKEIRTSQSLSKLPEVKPYQTPNSSLIIASVTSESLPQIRRLTGTLLPITYPDDFYEEAVSLDPTRFLSRQVIFTSKDGSKRPVGWIRCRLEAVPDSTPSQPQTVISALNDGLRIEPTQIYIQALCLLAPYRGYGAASALLDSILADVDVLKALGVLGVYAHVWEESTDAMAWYRNRGFQQKELIKGYYRKLKPSGAWVVSLPLDLDNNVK